MQTYSGNTIKLHQLRLLVSLLDRFLLIDFFFVIVPSRNPNEFWESWLHFFCDERNSIEFVPNRRKFKDLRLHSWIIWLFLSLDYTFADGSLPMLPIVIKVNSCRRGSRKAANKRTRGEAQRRQTTQKSLTVQWFRIHNKKSDGRFVNTLTVKTHNMNP